MSITADSNTPTFPSCPSFGFTSEPMYRVRVTQRDGGFERVDRRWSHPLHRYTGVPIGERVEAEIQDLLHFWHAIGGQSTLFRFKDWADYKSCKVTETPSLANASPISPNGTASPPTSWRLVKSYSIMGGLYTQLRPITRPRGSTITIANASGVTQTDYTLNEATGVLTIGGTFSGEPAFWWGEFDVPCRFDSELPVEITQFRIARATVSICEKRERLT